MAFATPFAAHRLPSMGRETEEKKLFNPFPRFTLYEEKYAVSRDYAKKYSKDKQKTAKFEKINQIVTK